MITVITQEPLNKYAPVDKNQGLTRRDRIRRQTIHLWSSMFEHCVLELELL